MSTIDFVIDDKALKADAGSMIIEVADVAGIYIHGFVITNNCQSRLTAECV